MCFFLRFILSVREKAVIVTAVPANQNIGIKILQDFDFKLGKGGCKMKINCRIEKKN